MKPAYRFGMVLYLSLEGCEKRPNSRDSADVRKGKLGKQVSRMIYWDVYAVEPK